MRIRRCAGANCAPRIGLVTSCAGFIGTYLAETLLNLGPTVVGLASFAIGHRHNLVTVQAAVVVAAKADMCCIEGDVRNLVDCQANRNFCFAANSM